jgi:hypothetical protein
VQVFLAVRDRQRRVAVLSLLKEPDLWMLPSENVWEGRDPAHVVEEIVPRWFVTPLEPKLAAILNFPPEDDDERWFLLPIYEAAKPARLEATPDTHEVRFVAPGEAPPGRMFKDHAEVLARLGP